jgi:hypothetical protein
MKKLSRRLTVLLLAAALLLTAGCKKSEPAPSSDENSGFRIGYAAEGVTIVDDADALQKEYDEMMEAAKEKGMTLSYQNDAVSENGVDVNCYIANSIENAYDMFIAIYADDAFTDELYLSQLLRPGTAFNSIQLNRKLEPGVHTVYVVYTQVVVEDDEQKIHDQNIVTLDIHVLGG